MGAQKGVTNRMENGKLTLDEMLVLMDKMQKTGLGTFCLADGDYKLKIEAKTPVQAPSLPPAPPAMVQQSTPVENVPAAPAAEPSPAEALEEGTTVKSPIVGTFYDRPSPEKPAFIQVGQQVKKGDVLFIIESMKLMNEIQSELDGVIKKILVENGQPVEFGQPIVVIG